MSMTGSLMGYENNNDVNQAKCKKPLKPLPVVSSISSSGVTTSTAKPKKARRSTKKDRRCAFGHVNNLWSVWYGTLAVSLQAYIGLRCARRFSTYISLPWAADAPPPENELYVCLALLGTGLVLLPVFLSAACLKLGNLANDGIKLGRHLSACSRDPPSALYINNSDNSLASNLWRHGGPTAAFVHLCTAMCFLLPSLLMEARLIHAGFLPKDAIWRTDLDWIVIHRDRLVLLSFMNPIGNLSSLTGSVTPQPFLTLTPEEGINENLDEFTTSTPGLTNMALPDVVETHVGETTTTFSTILHPIVTDPPLSRTTTPSPGTTSGKTTTTATTTTATSTETTSTISKTTMLPKNNTARRPTARTFTKSSNSKRSKAKNLTRISTTTRSSRAVGNMTAQSMSLTMNSLADLDHPENLNLELQTAESYGPITLEYLNYAAALGVYSVRYPAVFWSCNKALGTIFSLQLVINSAQSLLAYAGMSVLYKVQVVGALKALPLLRHRTVATTSTISTIFGDSYFLLDPPVTLVLFALSSFLVLCSSMVMYFYAHGRFTAFLNQERERRVILLRDGREGNGWVYLPHCAALVVFLAISICGAPLLYDYTVVYRGSLDGAILACIIGVILHLLLWLLLWIILTIKQRWTFKMRVTIGRATVRSARSMKLVTDVDLLSAKDDDDGTSAPLLIVDNGRTYTIADTSPKRAIMNVIQKAAMEKKARSQGGNVDGVDGESTADGDEQIYWLRPKLRPSPAQSPSDNSGAPTSDKGWLNKKLKHKVTFNDLPSTSGSRNKGKARRGVADGGPDDDGDYATLRELPLVTSLDPADDSTSEENKLLECVNDDQVTYYASANRDLQPSEGDPSPLLTPDPLPDPVEEEPLPLPPPTPTSAPTTDIVTAPLTTNVQMNGGQTPRCLRRADSGMPHDELTPRSDSSNSPPLDAVGSGGGGAGSVTGHSNTSSNSETSSGVHSNASNASNASHTSSQTGRRATSVDDLTGEPREEPREQWRSCSLQRGTQPPTANTTFSPPNSRPSTSQSFSSPQYVNHVPPFANAAGGNEIGSGCPAVILENPNEATVVIRRKLSRAKLTDPLNANEEPFGRSTNMRMTSFTESNDIRIQASSATLPHYPTQPIVTYPHCSTMPLPHASSHSVATANMSGGSTGSCGSVPKHTFVPPQVHTTMPAHTTLPSHHNGVRLLHNASANPNNPFVKRFPPVQLHTQPWALPGHHTFPQMPPNNNKLTATAQIRQSDRDSANFSMASSGDSDTCLPH
ncbi:protein tincar isoform X2 [Linepithema humile]|uniref:protein tincar isoform X2 n=1 Tax=Linepithema humile TaxID=83485 RepID=UPI0006237D01|nr:PREDICTED: protein tincar isoform X2 [Linepithema humile]